MSTPTRRFQPFGRHLHNQIVMPLLAGSMCVALIAMVVAVYALSAITFNWIDGSAYQATVAVRTQFDDIALALVIDAGLIAQDPAVAGALRSGDAAVLQDRLNAFRPLVGADHLLLVDQTGVVLARAGVTGFALGARPLGPGVPIEGPVQSFATFTNIEGSEGITAIHRFDAGGRRYTLLVTRVVDTPFLESNFAGIASALAFSDDAADLDATYVDRQSGGSGDPGRGDSGTGLRGTLNADNPAVAEAYRQPGRTFTFEADGQPYAVRAERVSFAKGAGTGIAARRRPADPTGAERVLLVVLSNKVASETSRTTLGLIAFWSTLAVLVLTGLGTVIARRVSGPLNSLAESARHVAEGDFTAKVEISGTNEVAELADAFNSMTDSLRERTESLTKKVLELATLYEMSRALGSTLDLDVLLDSVLDSAMRIFNVDSGYVMLRDKYNGRLDLRAWRGMSGARPDERAIRSSMSDWVVRQGRPLIFNPAQENGVESHVDSVTGALAALCVPLISSEGVIGAIAVGSRDGDYRFSSDDVRLLSTIANHVTIAIGNIELFSSLQDAYLATVRSLAAAVDAKDPYTRGHSERVAGFARAIAERLGLSTEQCTALEMAAYLHDIGKIGIREEILLKPGKLDAEEMGQMRHHPLIGANILKPVAFPWPITPVVRHHHEHYDGHGYPAGLKGEEIPLLARILTVADAYEAMTADRPYRAGRCADEAIEELRRCADAHFDGRVVSAFIEALREMDDEAAVRRARAVDEVQPEEARAIFVAVVDGMYSSFRRLGGPRLASNFEAEIAEWLAAEAPAFTFHGGHMSADWDRVGPPEEQFRVMRRIVDRTAQLMGGTTGRSLVDHFYDEAVADLSERMRELASLMDLYRRL